MVKAVRRTWIMILALGIVMIWTQRCPERICRRNC